MTQRVVIAGVAASLAVFLALLTVVVHNPKRSVLSQLPPDYFVTHSGDSEGAYFNAHPTQYDQSGKPFANRARQLQLKSTRLPSDYFVTHSGDSEGAYFNAHPTQYDQNGKPFARGARKPQLRTTKMPALREIFPATPEWQTTPNSVGQGDGSIPGQETNVFDNGYVFPDYARRGGWRLVYLPDKRFSQFKPRAAGQQLWGGQYSSVGEFPVGYRGQLTEGGEWNVWALPTQEQMQQKGSEPGCPCAQYDSPLQTIDEINVLDDIGNDPDSAVWNPKAPAETTAKCNCDK